MTTSTRPRELIHDGRLIATFVPFEQEHPTVDDVEIMVPTAEAVPILLREFAGHWFSSHNDALTNALLAAGCTVARHGHRFRHGLLRRDLDSLGTPPPVPAALSVGPVTASALSLGALSVAAYPGDHVDHETTAATRAAVDLSRLLAGELVGPFVDVASIQLSDGQRPVAVCIINRMPDGAGASEPWVSEVFRHPAAEFRGLGAVLLRLSLEALSASDESSLGLVVTDGNPAESVYRTLGFKLVRSTRKLQIPPYVECARRDLNPHVC